MLTLFHGVQHPSYANETLKQNVGGFLNKGETPAFWAAGHGQVWTPRYRSSKVLEP